MAYSASNTFHNSIVGNAMVGGDVDVLENHTTPKYAVGTRFVQSDGAVFVYAHFGTAVNRAGHLVAQDISESGTAHSNTESRIYASASVTSIAGETIKPGTAGSRYIQVKGGGVAADQFAGGYIHITAGAGVGAQYRIRGNTASAALTSGALLTYYIELYSALKHSLDGSSKMRIVGSQYANLESSTAVTDCFVAGVNCASAAAATWGWVQRTGLAAIRTDVSGISTGSLAAASQVTAGCVAYVGAPGKVYVGSDLFKQPLIGYCVAGATNGAIQMAAICLTLE